MKLLIVGSRSIQQFDLEPYLPSHIDLIISGGANGIDTIAEQYADKHRISKFIMRPSYSSHGRSAPLKRNEKMVEFADSILVIWDGVSKGTLYTIEYAQKQNKPIRVIHINEKETHDAPINTIS